MPGRGLTGSLVRANEQCLQQVTRSCIFPGSLNLLLSHPLLLDPRHGQRLTFGELAIWPARLGILRVWIFRWQDAPLHCLEILADSQLRRQLALVDGAMVCVDVDDFCCIPLHSHQSLAWRLAWQGRRSWYYTSTHYHSVARVFCGLLGATQSIPQASPSLPTMP